jgi:hypothetical protein
MENNKSMIIKGACAVGIVSRVVKQAHDVYGALTTHFIAEEHEDHVKDLLLPICKWYGFDITHLKIVKDDLSQVPSVFKNKKVTLLCIPSEYVKKDHYLLEAALGHEAGHATNNHSVKYALSSLLLKTITGCGDLLLLYNLDVSQRLNARNLCCFVGGAVLEGVEKLTYMALRRKAEKEADQHLVKYAQDPKVLRAFARDLVAQESKDCKLLANIKRFTKSHPDPFKRAVRFKKAAALLDAQRLI